MGQTLAEKILSEHAGQNVRAGELAIINVDVCLTQDGTGPLAVRQLEKLDMVKAANPDRTVLFIDHSTPSARKELSNDHMLLREFAKKTGSHLSEIGDGVCHQVISERWLKPGDVLIGADSHTCTGDGVDITVKTMAAENDCGELDPINTVRLKTKRQRWRNAVAFSWAGKQKSPRKVVLREDDDIWSFSVDNLTVTLNWVTGEAGIYASPASPKR